MCTLAVAVRPSPTLALVVAANRDELLARPASGPRIRPGAPAILAPRDEVAGGTWLGLNAHRVFVGVTNRAGSPRDPTRRSRGALVADALGAPSAAALHAQLAGLDPAAHNPFHLLYADRSSAHLTWSDGAVLHQRDLPPGLHVVTERSFGAGDERRADLVRSLWPVGGEPGPATLGPLLARHADDPFAATCVHFDAFAYGTRSSMLLALGDRWEDTRLWWAEGRPCQTSYVELGALVDELRRGQRGRRREGGKAEKRTARGARDARTPDFSREGSSRPRTIPGSSVGRWFVPGMVSGSSIRRPFVQEIVSGSSVRRSSVQEIVSGSSAGRWFVRGTVTGSSVRRSLVRGMVSGSSVRRSFVRAIVSHSSAWR